MKFLRNRLLWATAGLLAGVAFAVVSHLITISSVVSPIHAEVGSATFTGSTASFSATLTQGGNQPIRTAFGPLRLDYKSGPDTWTTGLLIRQGDGNVSIGSNITSADFNSASKLRVLGVVESTTGGFKFPDGTTQTTAASAVVGGGWTDGGTSVYLTTGTDSVGIGDSTPSTKLDVAGEITSGSLGAYGNIRMISGSYGSFFRNDGTNTYLLLTNSADQYGVWNSLRPLYVNNGNGDLYLTTENTFFPGSGIWGSSGSVGIGTTGPSSILDVRGADSVNARIYLYKGSNQVALLGTGDGTAGLESGLLQLRDNNGSIAVQLWTQGDSWLNTSGNVGIGTTTPGAKLEVVGNINSTTGAIQTAGVTRIDNSGVGTLAAGTTVGGAGIPGGSGFNSLQTFTTSGTWTKPSGVTKVIVEVIGGAGGGGGGNGALWDASGSPPGCGNGGGGASGGYSRKFIDVSAVSSVTVTVGAGGGGGAAGGGGNCIGGSAGGAGGTSSFGAYATATGGTAGNKNSSLGTAGVGSSGDLNEHGQDGGPLIKGAYGFDLKNGGTGGLGCYASPSCSGTPGTDGLAGKVLVWEYK